MFRIKSALRRFSSSGSCLAKIASSVSALETEQSDPNTALAKCASIGAFCDKPPPSLAKYC